MTDTKPKHDSPEVIALVKEGLDLVDVIARQLRRQFSPYVQVDDLVGQGREALLAAARSYDPARGVPFKRWANLRIRGAMIDAVRAQGNLPKRVYRTLRAIQAADNAQSSADETDAAAPPQTPEAADARLGDRLGGAAMAMAIGMLTMRSGDALDHAADRTPSPEDAVASAELAGYVREALADQPEQERLLVQRFYFDDIPFEETAKELGLSKSWASRLHTRALESMWRHLKRHKVA